MANYDEYSEDMRGELRKEFAKQNPEYWRALQGRPEDIMRVRYVETHTQDAERILNENYKEERQERVARVAVEVWNERAKQFEFLAPHVRAQVMAENSILAEARRRVDEQHDQDLALIHENKREAIERIAGSDNSFDQPFSKEEIETMTDQEKDTHFKAELHKLIDDSNSARFQVSKIMNNERERMLEEAKQNGSQDPISDVKALSSSMYKGVQDKLHGDIHGLCLRYGYKPDHQQIEFIANGDVQDMTLEKNDYDATTEVNQSEKPIEDDVAPTPAPNKSDEQEQ